MKANKDFEGHLNLPKTQDETKNKEIEIVNDDPNELMLTDIEELDSDFLESRNRLEELMDRGMKLFSNAAHVAESSESPRSFEVASDLMKNLANMQKDLMELHAKRKSTKSNTEKSSNGGTNNIENAIFVGTTKDLLDVVNETKNKNTKKDNSK